MFDQRHYGDSAASLFVSVCSLAFMFSGRGVGTRKMTITELMRANEHHADMIKLEQCPLPIPKITSEQNVQEWVLRVYMLSSRNFVAFMYRSETIQKCARQECREPKICGERRYKKDNHPSPHPVRGRESR